MLIQQKIIEEKSRGVLIQQKIIEEKPRGVLILREKSKNLLRRSPEEC